MTTEEQVTTETIDVLKLPEDNSAALKVLLSKVTNTSYANIGLTQEQKLLIDEIKAVYN